MGSRSAYYAEAADLPDFLAHLDGMEKAVRAAQLACGRDGAAKEALALLDDFKEGAGAEQVQWPALRGRGFVLHQTPQDIASSFQQRPADYGSIGVYTSATLAVDDRFDHFAGQLGLTETPTQAWQSPFDFERQALLYLPHGLPDPRHEDYTEQLVAAALPVLELTQGRAFFLFTNHRALRLASKSYGRIFLNSLPPIPRCYDLDEVAAFFSRHEGGGVILLSIIRRHCWRCARILTSWLIHCGDVCATPPPCPQKNYCF